MTKYSTLARVIGFLAVESKNIAPELEYSDRVKAVMGAISEARVHMSTMNPESVQNWLDRDPMNGVIVVLSTLSLAVDQYLRFDDLATSEITGAWVALEKAAIDTLEMESQDAMFDLPAVIYHGHCDHDENGVALPRKMTKRCMSSLVDMLDDIGETMRHGEEGPLPTPGLDTAFLVGTVLCAHLNGYINACRVANLEPFDLNADAVTVTQPAPALTRTLH